MHSEKMRVLILCTHATQYGSPLFRLLAGHPALDIQVAYCSLHGAESHVDPGFGVPIAWDIPLLDGYPWIKLRNVSPRSDPRKFFGLINPEIWPLVRSGKFDAVVALTGYMCASFWIALLAAKLSGIPILFGTDSHDFAPLDRRAWKKRVKKYLWPRVFGLADVVFAPSTGSMKLMHSLGLPPERVILTPFSVSNDWWTTQAERADRSAVRRSWDIPVDAAVALFCAKLQAWKRPQDLLRAFAKANVPGAYLVYAGDGPMRKELEAEAAGLGLKDRVRFLGFVNQSGLPEVYRASDVLVLPSEYEPFGLVVNEAMLCGLGAIISDRVGAKFDLVTEGQTGFIYPSGNVDSLSSVLARVMSNPGLLRRIGAAGRLRIADWSPQAYVDGLVRAVAQAVRLKGAINQGAVPVRSMGAR